MPTIKKIVEQQISWFDLKAAADEGKLTDFLSSGDIIPVTLNDGEMIELEIGRNGFGKFFFIFKDCLEKEEPMNLKPTIKGGWKSSHMRDVAKNAFSRLPQDLQDVIVPQDIYQYEVSDNSLLHSKDYLFLLSSTEVFGKDAWLSRHDHESDSHIDIFKDEKSRVKQLNGKTWWYFLRSAASTNSFAMVSSGGGSYNNSASNSYGVVFSFCLEP